MQHAVNTNHPYQRVQQKVYMGTSAAVHAYTCRTFTLTCSMPADVQPTAAVTIAKTCRLLARLQADPVHAALESQLC